jgi:hypothetical protein
MTNTSKPAAGKRRHRGLLANWFDPQPGTMLSPGADFLMAGGASLIFYAFLLPFGSSFIELAYWAAALYFAAFIVNYPHFAASYQLLYQDLRSYFVLRHKHVMFSLRLWWAGIIVPIVLIGYFFFFLYVDSPTALGFLVNVMLFTVGWHYVKQVFGCTVVLSAAKNIYYTKWERYALLAPLYLLWLFQYARVNVDIGTQIYFGVPYTSLGVPHSLYVILATGLSLGLITLVVVLGRKFYQYGRLAPTAALAAFVSVFVWFHPAITSIYFLAIVPLFHSLQYLLFVAAYKKNEALTATDTTHQPQQKNVRQLTLILTALFIVTPIIVILIAVNRGLTGRLETVLQTYVAHFSGSTYEVIAYGLLATAGVVTLLLFRQLLSRYAPLVFITTFVLQMVVIGALLFGIIPAVLDTLVLYERLPWFFNYDVSVYGATLYLFFFTVFVNIHHFFIDNVIWRRDNPKVRQFLYAHPAEQFELDGKLPS